MTKNRTVEFEILRRLEVRRFEKRLDEKSKRKQRNKQRFPSGHARLGRLPYTPSKDQNNNKWWNLDVPRVLDLIGNRDLTCNFFSEVRDLVRSGRRVRLVFMETEQISPDALIFLLGQVHRLRLENGDSRITGTYPKSKKVERLLEESGFFQALKVTKRGVVVRRSRSTRYLKFKTDTKINAQEIPNLRDELLGSDLKMPSVFGKKVYRALSEAMTNVTHHAYHNKSVRNRALTGRWWLAAQLSVRSSLFTLTFYDAGVGIPKTLPRKYTWELIRSVLSMLPTIMPDDGQMIQAAIELGRSRTGADNRGKGLMDLLKLIDTVGGGSIRILSRNGSYKYGDCGEGVTNHDGFVEGTLIKWEVPLGMALVSIPEASDDDPDS